MELVVFRSLEVRVRKGVSVRGRLSAPVNKRIIMLFECHITVSTDDAEAATTVAKMCHWKTSEIARDPILGDKNFFYLTSHATDYNDMWSRLKAASRMLQESAVPVLREKIELIMFDTKVKV